MRVAHATDIHWFHPPAWQRMSPKRLLGSANLYLRGRRHHFEAAVQGALVDAILEQEPDLVVITGDLTAQALPEEFARAREVLAPLLERVPTFVIPGNHDVYTGGAWRDQRIQRYFGDVMYRLPSGLGLLRVPGVTVVGLDPNRPHWSASGLVPQAQLAALPATLADVAPEDVLVLALHYPVLHRTGSVYEGWEHGLRNARDLIDVLAAARRHPDVIIHGHVHHGFTVDLPLGSARVPIHNPGSGGYALMSASDRAACFNVYTFEEHTIQRVDRFRYTRNGFAPEPGGAYATGR